MHTKEGEFEATTTSGAKRTFVIWGTTRQAKSQSGTSTVPGMTEVTTENGAEVLCLGGGDFQIFGMGGIWHSDDPKARSLG